MSATTGEGSDRFLSLVRQALAYEDGDRLVIGEGIPFSWLNTSPRVLKVTGYATSFGELSYALTYRPRSRSMLLTLEGTARPRNGFEFHVTAPGALKSVTIDGAPQPVDPNRSRSGQNTVRLGRDVRKVEVTLARAER
jgi:hypothetical protein